jgi:hypothetical protein
MTTPEPPVEGQPYYAEPPVPGYPYRGELAYPRQVPPAQELPPAPRYPQQYQQQPYAPQYPPPYPYPYPYARPTNGMAIAAMVLGILWLYWVGSVLALIFGYLARAEIRRTGHGGDGMAIAGIVLGWVGVGTLAIVFIFGVAYL